MIEHKKENKCTLEAYIKEASKYFSKKEWYLKS